MRTTPTGTPPGGGGGGAPALRLGIVGAGPAGLAVALAVRRRFPTAGLQVIDPAGDWLAVWERQFAYQQIPHLRSPAVHHPHPASFALLERARDEDLVPSGGTRVPTTSCFADFCHDAIAEHDLSGVVRAGAATGLSLRDGVVEVAVATPDGGRVTDGFDRVVVAANRRVPVLPDWAVGAPNVRLANEVDVREVEAGARIAIVGGGMTAGHLCVGAVAAGAHVHHVTRRRLRVRRYDTDPGWLGPKQLGPFERETDMGERRRRVDAARGGGSITHRIAGQLAESRRRGVVTHHERDRVVEVTDGERHGGVRVRLDGGVTCEVDEVWVATGARVDVGTDPLLRHLRAMHPVELLDGLPVIEHDLSWGGAPVHLVGAAAALQLGPLAGNLVGHRRGAERVLEALRPGSSTRGAVSRSRRRSRAARGGGTR